MCDWIKVKHARQNDLRSSLTSVLIEHQDNEIRHWFDNSKRLENEILQILLQVSILVLPKRARTTLQIAQTHQTALKTMIYCVNQLITIIDSDRGQTIIDSNLRFAPLLSSWSFWSILALVVLVFDIVPISGKHCSSTSLEALHHRPPLLLVAVLVDLLEKNIAGVHAVVFVVVENVSFDFLV